MTWNMVYLIIAIVLGILGIWNLALRRGVFLSLMGVVWFLVVLFKLYIPQVYAFRLVSGIPELGPLLLFVVIPVLMFLAFFIDRRG